MPSRQSHAEDFTPALLEDIVRTLGTRGNRRLRIGASFILSILETPPETLAKSLRRMLASAEAADVPILITLDGQNWWQSRGDLWNWWDANLPGYDPANRANVEWTGWGPQHAVKIGWRNWGRQFRVRPAPNIASPRFLAEHWKAYDALVPIIADWYRALPPDRRYLFGGVKVGWEASINVNAFYFRDGNRIFDESPDDASKDPQQHDPKDGWTFGHPPLGFAAVSTAGIKNSGELTKADIEIVVHQYLARMAAEVRRRGIPPHLIFTHQGGTYAPWERHLSFKPAINEDSIPGWSFYSHDPPDCGSLAADLESAGRRQWAACEWWRGGGSAGEWREKFERSLRFKDCRFVCVYNWPDVQKLPFAATAIGELVSRATTQPEQ